MWHCDVNVLHASLSLSLSLSLSHTHTHSLSLSASLGPRSFNNSHQGLRDDVSLADDLKKNVRVLIWVMTYKQKLYKNAVHVRDTWARRANPKVIYVSSENDTSFPAVGLDIEEGWNHLTDKTMNGFRYMYDHHFDDADWFMKADDDTYVIVENLRYFLADKNPDEPVFYGQRYHNMWGVFTSGGAGYVLSKEALRRLATAGRDPKVCHQTGDKEDVRLAWCMEHLGVKMGNTKDDDGRETFFGWKPDAIINNEVPGWYTQLGGRVGIEKMSHFPVSFHKITPQMMHTLDYLLYYARPFGIQFGHDDYEDSEKEVQ